MDFEQRAAVRLQQGQHPRLVEADDIGDDSRGRARIGIADGGNEAGQRLMRGGEIVPCPALLALLVAMAIGISLLLARSVRAIAQSNSDGA